MYIFPSAMLCYRDKYCFLSCKVYLAPCMHLQCGCCYYQTFTAWSIYQDKTLLVRKKTIYTFGPLYYSKSNLLSNQFLCFFYTEAYIFQNILYICTNAWSAKAYHRRWNIINTLQDGDLKDIKRSWHLAWWLN